MAANPKAAGPITYPEDVWAEIRERWERGETAGQIAKTPGHPSKVAINNRVKREGWERVSEHLPVGDDGKRLEIPSNLDPRRKTALQTLAAGGNYRDAAIAASVDESTFRRWREDEQFARLCEAAASGLKLEMLGLVKQGAQRDPKYATWMLEHHPATREEFRANKADDKLEVVININREAPGTEHVRGVTIDQNAVTDDSDDAA